jgi:predicted RNase H-like HicB family nuclease
MKHTERVRSKRYTYSAVFEQMDDGQYLVTFPELPGAVTYGENLERAREMAADCLRVHLEYLRNHRLPVPKPEKHGGPIHLEDVSVNLKTA